MHVEAVESSEGFLALEAEWTDLWRRSHRPSFFLSHRWFRCCWPHQPGSTRPLILVVRAGATPVAIAPLLRHRGHWRMFPGRVISLMQNQDSPFADLLLAADHGAQAIGAILEYLDRLRGWDLLAWAKIERTSHGEALLSQALADTTVVRRPAAHSPVLSLEGDWSTFWAGTSQRFKKTVRYASNRTEALGAITVEDLATTHGAAECLALFRHVAGRSWKADLPISVTQNGDIAEFFRRLTEVAHAGGELSLWVLRVDGVPIATEYHVRDGDTVYALRSDFDDDFRAASPGAYLNYVITRAYFERGVRRYDMGPGDSDYKRRWATGARELDTLWLFQRAPYARAVYALERFAVPALRSTRTWWSRRGAGAAPAPDSQP